MEVERAYKKSRLSISKRIDLMRKNFEQLHKFLLGKSFECAALCYSFTHSLRAGRYCVEKCVNPASFVHNRIDTSLKRACVAYDRCTESCHVSPNLNYTEELGLCIKYCTKNTLSEIALLEKQVTEEYKNLIGLSV
jgi:hypothetical protein